VAVYSRETKWKKFWKYQTISWIFS